MHFILFVKPDIESRAIQRLTGRGQGSVTNRVYQGEVKKIGHLLKKQHEIDF